ncbi:hypothetical protein ACFL9T_20555 [Thermodesulfobacteriota bacterium]
MTAIFLLVGLVGGGAISYLIAKHHYDREVKSLMNEVVKLRELNIRMLWRMEEAGLIKLTRDNEGNIVGLDVNSQSEPTIIQSVAQDETLH